jgi:hypothetical protein
MDSITNFGQYLKKLNRTYYVLLVSPLLFACGVIYLVEFVATAKNERFDIIFKYSLPILGFGLVMAGMIAYKLKLRKIMPADSLSEKLDKFHQAFASKFIFIEVVSVVSLFACVSTRNYQYMIILLLVTVIKTMSKPSEANILAALKLNEGEKEELLKGGPAITAEKEKPLLVRYPVLFVVVLSFSAYSFYDDLIGIMKKEEWSAEEKKQMVDDCLLKAKDMAVNHPEEVKTYCECTNEAIFKKFTHREIRLNNGKLSSEELMNTLKPVFTECLKELKGKIKEKEKKINN